MNYTFGIACEALSEKKAGWRVPCGIRKIILDKTSSLVGVHARNRAERAKGTREGQGPADALLQEEKSVWTSKLRRSQAKLTKRRKPSQGDRQGCAEMTGGGSDGFSLILFRCSKSWLAVGQSASPWAALKSWSLELDTGLETDYLFSPLALETLSEPGPTTRNMAATVEQLLGKLRPWAPCKRIKENLSLLDQIIIHILS